MVTVCAEVRPTGTDPEEEEEEVVVVEVGLTNEEKAAGYGRYLRGVSDHVSASVSPKYINAP
jgi:hypothetical protein